jgi:hypothetical protein
MRTPYGVQYGREQLPVPTWTEEFELDEFSTKLSDVLSFGADFRTLFFYQQNPDTGTPPRAVEGSNSLWQMQGDVYLSFSLAKKIRLYLDKGIYTGFEIFGLLNVLPENGYIKIGKFIPAFGTRMDDHRTFIRTVTGFSPEFGRPELTGAEVAISPGPITVMGGVFNASDAGFRNEKAFLGRAEGLFKASDDLSIGIGGSVFTRKQASGGRTTLMGGFGSLSYQTVTVFGEVDLIENKIGSAKVTGLVSYVELDYILTPGLDLKVAYEFYDPDKEIKTGSTSRYAFGVEFFPLPGVEARPMYRIVKDEPTDVKNNEFQFVVHFYL